jgi:hypothetical protein
VTARSAKVCGNCGGTWMGTSCLDCGATLGIIADAAAKPGGASETLLRLLKQGLAERGGREIR